MKKVLDFKHLVFCGILVSGISILQSCVVSRLNTAQLVTVPDIIQMSKDSLSSKEIIAEIKHSHTVYSLNPDQLFKLRNEGVQDSVLNYMEETKIDAIRQNQRYADSAYWGMAPDGFYYGTFGWGWPYGYYGWGWGPTIVYSVNRGFGGGYYHGYHGGGGVRSGVRR